VKLSRPLSLSEGAQFKGVVDTYQWKGINVARGWPRKPRQPNTPLQKETKSNFQLMMKWIQTNPPSWALQWKATPSGRYKSNVSRQRSIGMNLQIAGALVPPPDVFNVGIIGPASPTSTLVGISVNDFTGFLPDKVRWRYRVGLEKPEPLTFYVKERARIRDSVPVPQEVPNVARYKDPLTQNFSVIDQTYILEIANPVPRVQVYAWSLDSANVDELLTPPYFST